MAVTARRQGLFASSAALLARTESGGRNSSPRNRMKVAGSTASAGATPLRNSGRSDLDEPPPAARLLYSWHRLSSLCFQNGGRSAGRHLKRTRFLSAPALRSGTEIEAQAGKPVPRRQKTGGLTPRRSSALH